MGSSCGLIFALGMAADTIRPTMTKPTIHDTVADLQRLLKECESLAESQEETRDELRARIRLAQAKADTQIVTASDKPPAG